ncbi:MAG: hypothetical protein H2B01_00925, partial [Nitrosopumilaceae archaeon]|nr:hypothetical protein [Nitrosopumilaceae archaeon]
MMNSQQMQQMMDDPHQRNQWMNTMMDDPQMRQQMMTHMMNNPDMMNMMMNDPDMMNMMMNDPDMMNMMMNNPDMMNMMMENNIMMRGNMMMGRHMMGTDMMSQGMMSSQSSQTIPKSEDPQTRTFQISMEEVEFYAEAENEEGEEGISFVELHRWEPNIIIVNQDDTVIEISNSRKHAHTLTIPAFNVNSELLGPREGMDTITFVADTPGVFTFYCGLP